MPENLWKLSVTYLIYFFFSRIQFQSILNTENFDAQQTLRITEVDRRTWLHVPSGTHRSTSSDTHQVVEIQIDTSTKMYSPWGPGGLSRGCVLCIPMRVVRLGWVRLGNCFTPYQRLWLYNGAPLVAFYDTLGIRRTYSRLKPPACRKRRLKWSAVI